jgi:hypothetical protein
METKKGDLNFYQFPTSKSTRKPNFAQIGGFCIWRPFCTLVTMATAAILIFFSTPQKLPHTTVDIPTKFHEAMVAILNPKYENPPIWAKFGFQVDYDVVN